MSKVEIYKLNNDGSQDVVAECHLGSDGAVCTGTEAIVNKLNQEGIINYSSEDRQERVFPSDGLVFLEQLPNTFNSGYLNASQIKKETVE